MTRQRDGQSLINDAYSITDLAAFTTRYPRPDVLRWINQGGAEFWDILLQVQGKAFGRSATPWNITTTANTTTYTTGFPTDFLELLTVRKDGPIGVMIRPLLPAEEAFLLEPGIVANSLYFPECYELVPGGLRLLPAHSAGLTIVVDYVKQWTDLTDSPTSFVDGIDGWEDYLVYHAASEMMTKEAEWDAVRAFEDKKTKLAARITRRAQKRDIYRPRRARDVRGEMGFVNPRRWRG